MSLTLTFIATVIDDGPEPDRDWRIRVESALRAHGMKVLPPEEIEVVDVAIVRGQSTKATAARALAVSAETERGALFSVWTDPRIVAVFLANEHDEFRSTWMRKLMAEPTLIDTNALECDVLVLSAIAMRDGVHTSTRLGVNDGFPRFAGQIPNPGPGLSGI